MRVYSHELTGPLSDSMTGHEFPETNSRPPRNRFHRTVTQHCLTGHYITPESAYRRLSTRQTRHRVLLSLSLPFTANPSKFFFFTQLHPTKTYTPFIYHLSFFTRISPSGLLQQSAYRRTPHGFRTPQILITFQNMELNKMESIETMHSSFYPSILIMPYPKGSFKNFFLKNST